MSVSAGRAASRDDAVRRRRVAITLLAVWGPGLVVMLADTDAGSLITAAQSGASWRYAMVLPELVLIPVLFCVQDAVARLGVTTGKGHGQLIRENFGLGWGLVSAAALFASAVGALLTEFVGVAGVGELFGLSKWLTVPVATAFLVGLAFTRSYRRVERVALALGLAELAFVPAMIATHPSWSALAHQLDHLPLTHHSFLVLLAANVGAVIMPWMVFYQQGAIVDKGLVSADRGAERRDTLVGAVVTQAIMIAVVVAFAATSRHGAPLTSVAGMARSLGATIGAGSSRALVGAAVLGGSLIAALVVSLAASWGISEVLGWRHSLNQPWGRSNRRFYLTYVAAHVLGAALVLASVDLVNLAVDVEVLNAMLLPVVLTMLLVLEHRVLPDGVRLSGVARWLTTASVGLVAAFGLAAAAFALGGWG